MVENKRNLICRTVLSIFGSMCGKSVVRAADRNSRIPILVHTKQGAVVLKLKQDSDEDYNAWFVFGDIPDPPFPTEDLFDGRRYRLDRIDTLHLRVSGTELTLEVRDGTLCEHEVQTVQRTLMWKEIGGRGGKQ